MSGKFHHTKNTVEASEYCNPCGRMTPHRIDAGRRGPCLVCMTKLAHDLTQAMPPESTGPEQADLFPASATRKGE
jgi:hypothetical protein